MSASPTLTEALIGVDWREPAHDLELAGPGAVAGVVVGPDGDPVDRVAGYAGHAEAGLSFGETFALDVRSVAGLMADRVAADVDRARAFPGHHDVLSFQVDGYAPGDSCRRDASGGGCFRPGTATGLVVGLHAVVVGHVGGRVPVGVAGAGYFLREDAPVTVAGAVPDLVAVDEGAVGGGPGDDVVVAPGGGRQAGGFARHGQQHDLAGLGPGGAAVLVAVLHPVAVGRYWAAPCCRNGWPPWCRRCSSIRRSAADVPPGSRPAFPPRGRSRRGQSRRRLAVAVRPDAGAGALR